MTEQSYVEQVAPMPEWGDDTATMDALVRAYWAEAQRAYTRSDHYFKIYAKFEPGSEEGRAPLRDYLVHLHAFIGASEAADLLATIGELAPEKADEFARGFISKSQSGDYYPETTWDELERRGIDPERIRAEQKAELEASSGAAPDKAGA